MIHRPACGLVCFLVAAVFSGACLGQEPVHPQPVRVVPMLSEDQQNLVPNASFECGTDDWGAAELDSLPGWYGALNGLFGQLDTTTAAHGRTSLKIELTPENQPIAYNDFLHTERRQIQAPLAANLGWIAVRPGQRYTFSLAMKAAEAGTPARLVVRPFLASPFEKLVHLSTQWQRYAIEFTPQAGTCYVLAGPDLRTTPDNPQPPARATVWLDAVQLAPSGENVPFTTRQPVELGLTTDKPGNVFAWDEPVRLRITVACGDARQERAAEIALRLTDFFDNEVWQDRLTMTVPAGSSREEAIVLEPSIQRRGFLRLHATLTSETSQQRTLRLAVIPQYELADSRFGLNHAFGWPEMLALCRQAGLVWMRDWSLTWQDVEPVKGQFRFVESDAQINRILHEQLRVLSVLAFPSANWSSSAPESVRPFDPWYGTAGNAPDAETRRDMVYGDVERPYLRMGYAPRDPAEFENYVGRTVAQYKDRIHDWQVFNEPISTPCSLHMQAGYKTADYLRYIESFARAARRSDPHCRILGGFALGGLPPLSMMMEEAERLIALGGLKYLDVLALHDYPQKGAPEIIEPALQRLLACMDAQGVRRPIWFTECAYWADDEPWRTLTDPFVEWLASERVQAEYLVRWSTLLLANGVEKIFFHAGTGAAINCGNPYTMFLRYGSEPFKCYPTQAVLAQLLTPSCSFVKRLLPEEPVRAYLFRDTARTVAVVWAPADANPPTLQLANAKLEVWDLVGRPQASRTFTPSETPVYVVGEGVSPEDLEKALVPQR